MLLASTLSTPMTSAQIPHHPYSQGANILRSWIDDPRLRNAFAQKEPAILSELLSGHQQTQRQEPRKTAP
jgi:hypothetical protein